MPLMDLFWTILWLALMVAWFWLLVRVIVRRLRQR